ncbi:Universal stress protein [Streptomyces sp. RB5]|uniref:Universal stress protein n=1 Tax=Streptomyces smaragdinus TaxID=2585196 RepID=A0A7K0CAL8_9ACTN|nr:universal stress protein [Streptomyces smaragdinus]MQY10497.1 Universal stress protein [Streptomyces smaragdinus]
MAAPLVVGVDGSDAARRALEWAVDEAVRHGAALRIVYASLWEYYDGSLPAGSPPVPAGRGQAEHIVASAAELAQARGPRLKLTADILAEDTVPGLLRAGRDSFAVVVGDRGRGRLPLPLGSTALAVASRAQGPVIVVRGGGRNTAGGFDRVVLGVGETGERGAAVGFAFREASVRGGRLDAIRAWRSPERGVATHAHTLAGAADPRMRDAEWALQHAVKDSVQRFPDVDVRRVTAEGPARNALLLASDEADLVVVGARRRTGQSGIHLGHVNHDVLQHASCPVAVVPER